MRDVKPTILFCLTLLVVPVHGEPEDLSVLDADLLLERLKALREGSDERIESRYRTAHTAFRAAIQTDSGAHELYLKCVEKVQFEDEKRKAQDFREWKRRHKERTDTPEFRRALRHQLNWLLLTLEAASEPDKRSELGTKALERIDQIYADADKLEGAQSRLEQNVLQSVYATAYELNGIQLEDWPTAPLQLSAVYENLILPPLRQAGKIETLRSAWNKRILHEGTRHQVWGRRGSRDDRPAALELFLAERRPQLTWEMEDDLFNAGDQKGAALRMLAHLEKYLAHKNGADWIGEFESLVEGQRAKLTLETPGEPVETTEGSTTPGT